MSKRKKRDSIELYAEEYKVVVTDTERSAAIGQVSFT
jgi:hypothetical protein